MKTTHNITIHIKPYVVDYASLYGVTYSNLFNLAYENAAELINEIEELGHEIIDSDPQGYIDGDGYSCTWQLTKDDNDKYIFTIIDMVSDKAPEDIEAEQKIIEGICK